MSPHRQPILSLNNLALRTDLLLLQASGSEIEEYDGYLIVRSPEQPHFYWGNCLILRKAPVPGGEREAIRVFENEFPDARHRAIGLDVADPDAEVLARFEQAGLSVERSNVLATRTLKDPKQVHAESVIRPLEDDDDWEAWVRFTVGSNTRRPGEWGFARGKAAQERKLAEASLGIRWGAFIGDDLVASAGLYLAGENNHLPLARFQNVHTHEDLRGQGLATTLLHTIGSHGLRERYRGGLGAKQLIIVADPEGPAISLYRKLGFIDISKFAELIRLP